MKKIKIEGYHIFRAVVLSIFTGIMGRLELGALNLNLRRTWFSDVKWLMVKLGIIL